MSLGRIAEDAVLGRGRPAVLTAVLALTVLAAWFAAGATQELSNASMNSSAAAEREVEDGVRRDFGTDEIVVLAVTRADLLSAPGLAMVRSLTERIAALDDNPHLTGLVVSSDRRDRCRGRGSPGRRPVPRAPGRGAARDRRRVPARGPRGRHRLTGGDVRIPGRSSPVVLDLSAAYVRRNMALIVADSFGVPEAEARARLVRARTP